jgi:peptide-methionine (S)-S-oxide reductase
MQKATIAAGCFWGIEATFARQDGVVSTAVGYTGGDVDSPNYDQVCTGQTGHAEAVLIEFDASRFSYEQLLDVFWACHDPTTLNRQGPDVGSQYRSAIFYHDDAQREAAEASKRQLDATGTLPGPVVTEIAPAATFHMAEEYHQKYLAKCGRDTCGG